MTSTSVKNSTCDLLCKEGRLAPALPIAGGRFRIADLNVLSSNLRNLRIGFQLLLILFIAFALKQSYSTATANQLRWILTPTAFLVELVTGRHFTFESHAGYMSSDHTFLIAASCAGVNFLITTFLMLALMSWWNTHQSQRPQTLSWLTIPSALTFAYVATVIANTVRISTSLQHQQNPVEISWLTRNDFHRLEGIFIYFGFLLLLYVLIEKLAPLIMGKPAPLTTGKSALLLMGKAPLTMGKWAPHAAATPSGVRNGYAFPGMLPIGSRGYAPKVESIAAQPHSTRKGTNPPRKLGGYASVKSTLVPLAIYYTTTLAIPFANGAYRNSDFWQHSAFVLLTPLSVILPLLAFRLYRSRKFSS